MPNEMNINRQILFKNGLAISYYKLGEFYRENMKNKKKSRTHFLNAKVYRKWPSGGVNFFASMGYN
jgi:hypothetical protein